MLIKLLRLLSLKIRPAQHCLDATPLLATVRILIRTLAAFKSCLCAALHQPCSETVVLSAHMFSHHVCMVRDMHSIAPISPRRALLDGHMGLVADHIQPNVLGDC